MRRCNARATSKVDPIHPEQQKLLQCPGPTVPGWPGRTLHFGSSPRPGWLTSLIGKV